MVTKIAAADWSAGRGEAWRDSMAPLEAMLAPVNAPLIEALDLDGPYRIADIGCGGGETSIAIARDAQPGSAVAGFDISPALIDAATAKQARASAPVEFHIADAGQPRPTELEFDRLTSRFGIMFFPDPERAFANLARWIKPDGRFSFAVWAPPAENPWMSSIRSVVSNYIELPVPDPDAPGPFRYQDVSQFMRLLEQSGFNGVASDTWNHPLSVGGGMSAEDAAEFALTAFSIGQQLDQNDQVATRAARAELAALFSNHIADGVVQMAASVHIVTGGRAQS